MQRFQLDVGRNHQVKPGNIVGAIANEADLESRYIGEIEIRDGYSTVDLPADMPAGVKAILKKVHVSGRPMGLKVYEGEVESSEDDSYSRGKPKKYHSKRNRSSDKSRRSGNRKNSKDMSGSRNRR